MELGQKVNQLILIPQQDIQDGFWLIGIGHEHFEHVEGLKLDVASLLLQHVHHELEVVGIGNIFGHHREVVPVEQELAQQLEGLPPSHIVVTVQKPLILHKHLKQRRTVGGTGTLKKKNY